MKTKGIVFVCIFFCGVIGIMTAKNEESFWISYALFSIGGYLFCQYYDGFYNLEYKKENNYG